jgi:hypothetical protein
MLMIRYLAELKTSPLVYWKNGFGAKISPEGKSRPFKYRRALADPNSVNLGGWLVTERKHGPRLALRQSDNPAFIVPALYERYQKSTPKAIDEYTLSQA